MEKWIEKAFISAIAQAESAEQIAPLIEKALDKDTPHLLDMWGELIGSDMSIRMARIIAEDEKVQDALSQLVKLFFIDGFVTGMAEHNK